MSKTLQNVLIFLNIFIFIKITSLIFILGWDTMEKWTYILGTGLVILDTLLLKFAGSKNNTNMDNSRKEAKREKLLAKITETENLIDEWEDKQKLDASPNRRLEAKKEIEKLKEFLNKYETELEELEGKKPENPSKEEEGKRIIHTQNYFENIDNIENLNFDQSKEDE